MASVDDENVRFASEQLVIGCATMENLLRGLLDSKGKIAEEVHAIRKLGKTLRGGFGLFMLSKDSAKEIQAIGRLLSGPRDAVSRLSTWNKLAWDEDAALVAAITGLLDQQTHSAARKPPQETIDWCLARVEAARNNLLALPPEDLAARVETGIKNLRKKVCKRCRKLDRNGEEDFHDARKAVKAYLGAIGFLPEGLVVADPKMLELAEILGDENDLATLSFWLAEHGFTPHFAPSLWKKLEKARVKLRKRAIRDAAALGAPAGE